MKKSVRYGVREIGTNWTLTLEEYGMNKAGVFLWDNLWNTEKEAQDEAKNYPNSVIFKITIEEKK